MKIRIVILLTIAIGFIACNGTDDMLLSYQHSMQAKFYSRNTHKDTVLTVVKVWGVGKDELLYDGTQNLNELFLPLNMNDSKTEFVIASQTIQDIVTVEYKSHVQPVSGSGGLTMEIHLDTISATNTFIDSIAISHADIKYNENIENVKIFVY